MAWFFFSCRLESDDEINRKCRHKKNCFIGISLDHCLIHFRILLVFFISAYTTHSIDTWFEYQYFHMYEISFLLFKMCYLCVFVCENFDKGVLLRVGYFPCWIFYLDFWIWLLAHFCFSKFMYFLLYLCSITSNFKVRIHVKNFIVWHNK